MRTLGIVITINVLKHSKKELLLGVVTSPVSFFTLKKRLNCFYSIKMDKTQRTSERQSAPTLFRPPERSSFSETRQGLREPQRANSQQRQRRSQGRCAGRNVPRPPDRESTKQKEPNAAAGTAAARDTNAAHNLPPCLEIIKRR